MYAREALRGILNDHVHGGADKAMEGMRAEGVSIERLPQSSVLKITLKCVFVALGGCCNIGFLFGVAEKQVNNNFITPLLASYLLWFKLRI